MGEFLKEKTRTAEILYEELYQLCQGLALLVRKHNLQTVVFMDLFDTLDHKYGLPICSEYDSKTIESLWSPAGTICALAGLYALKCKDLKILYVSELMSNSKEPGMFNPFRKKLLIRDQGETQLYRSAIQENLYLLTSESRQEGTLDPYAIERSQQEEGFGLTLIQQSSTFRRQDGFNRSDIALQTKATLIQAIADGIILGLSKSGSNVRQLHCLQKVASSEQIMGSIVFP